VKDRIELTQALSILLINMIFMGERPIVDYVKRHDATQKMLFDQGLSKCDGVTKVSRHQRGMAADIYFVDGSRLVDPKMGHEYWHKRWEDMGGQPMIEWDCGHYEG